jgi:hypothetical protein
MKLRKRFAGNVIMRTEVYKDLKQPPASGKIHTGEVLRICLEHTLDEACYSGLDREILDASNINQVVSKEYRRASGGQSENIPILMVPQIRIWKFNGVLLIAYSMSRSSPAFHDVLAGVLPQLCQKFHLHLAGH